MLFGSWTWTYSLSDKLLWGCSRLYHFVSYARHKPVSSWIFVVLIKRPHIQMLMKLRLHLAAVFSVYRLSHPDQVSCWWRWTNGGASVEKVSAGNRVCVSPCVCVHLHRSINIVNRRDGYLRVWEDVSWLHFVFFSVALLVPNNR